MIGSSLAQMKGMLEGLMGEVRRMPYTVVAVLLLSLLTGGYILPSLVRADRTALAVGQLRHDVDDMRTTLLQETIRNRLATIDGQLYALEREEARYARDGHEAPETFAGYLRQLRTDREIAQMELSEVIAASRRREAPP